MHRIEIDQSGQISRFNTDTVFAFSDGIQHAIVIPAKVKLEANRRLKQQYKQIKEPYLKLFSAGIFLLIKDHLSQIEKMLIDEEFTGKETIIKGYLLNYIRTIEPTFTKDRILFWRIGKKSTAHQIALEIYRARKRRAKTSHAHKVIGLQEFLKILKLK